jgi:hypothetical protein
MKEQNQRFPRAVFSVAIATLLALAGVAPYGSTAYAQRRTTTRRTTTTKAPAKTASIYDRGYLKGYNAGFDQGQADWSRSAPRDYQSSEAYQQRDRSYDQTLASSEEYTQGFQLGFELGHTDGYYGRPKNLKVPGNAATLAKAAALADAERARAQQPQPPPDAQPDRPRGRDDDQGGQRRDRRARSSAPVNVPQDTELRLKLASPINTKTNRKGDTFTATVVSPAEYEGSTVTGHIANLTRSGRVSGKTELSLAFDSITLPDGRQGPLDADLEKILESEQVKKVDEEGRVESGSRTRDSEVRGGIGAAAGAIIGGIAGGGKGALIGLILGGAAGVGTVYVEGNKDLILDPGTEMLIKTAGRGRAR